MTRFVRKTTILFPTHLSDKEYKELTLQLIAKTNQLNSFHDKIEQLNMAASTFKKTHKSDICSLESDCRYLAMDLERRSRDIEIECDQIFDRDSGIVLFRRCDNGQIIPSQTRPMTSDEFMEIPFDDPNSNLESASLAKSDFEAFLDYLRNSSFSEYTTKLPIIKNILSKSKFKSIQSALENILATKTKIVSETDAIANAHQLLADPESF